MLEHIDGRIGAGRGTFKPVARKPIFKGALKGKKGFEGIADRMIMTTSPGQDQACMQEPLRPKNVGSRFPSVKFPADMQASLAPRKLRPRYFLETPMLKSCNPDARRHG